LTHQPTDDNLYYINLIRQGAAENSKNVAKEFESTHKHVQDIRDTGAKLLWDLQRSAVQRQLLPQDDERPHEFTIMQIMWDETAMCVLPWGELAKVVSLLDLHARLACKPADSDLVQETLVCRPSVVDHKPDP
jgi:hypothetical protein